MCPNKKYQEWVDLGKAFSLKSKQEHRDPQRSWLGEGMPQTRNTLLNGRLGKNTAQVFNRQLRSFSWPSHGCLLLVSVPHFPFSFWDRHVCGSWGKEVICGCAETRGACRQPLRPVPNLPTHFQTHRWERWSCVGLWVTRVSAAYIVF